MLVNNELDTGGCNNPSTNQAMQAQNPKLVAYTNEPPLGWIDPCPCMLTINSTVAPWDNKEMRCRFYAINRQQIVDVVNEGAGATSNFIFPDYAAMKPFQDAIKDIIAPIGSSTRISHASRSRRMATRWMPVRASMSGLTARPSRSDIVLPALYGAVGVYDCVELNDVGIDAVLRILEWGVFRYETGRGQFTAATQWDGCGSAIRAVVWHAALS